MIAVVASQQRYLGERLAEVAREVGQRVLRTSDVERILREMKTRGRILVVDMQWEEVQKPGVLSKMVNIGRVSQNIVVCVCPDRDEKLKEIAKLAQPEEVFIRYEMDTAFRDFMATVEAKNKKSKRDRK